MLIIFDLFFFFHKKDLSYILAWGFYIEKHLKKMLIDILTKISKNLISDEARLPAEFKHIIKQWKRN
jgi:hypothetical protein